MDWDAAGALIAVAVSAATFTFAMRIVRGDLARQRKELEDWKSDLDLLTIRNSLRAGLLAPPPTRSQREL